MKKYLLIDHLKRKMLRNKEKRIEKQKIDKKEHILITFYLLLISIVGVIAIANFFIPIFYLRHIFIVLTLSVLSVSLFYKFSFITKV